MPSIGNQGVYEDAAKIIRSAGAIIIAAGAGMGVDSGLPDFRGVDGFWRAYPSYQPLGIRFEELANPRHFHDDPTLAWGFYGHRLSLYRQTSPHRGFAILLAWATQRNVECFVVTSNVDGHFQKAGFPRDGIHEVHGSIHHLQCLEPCSSQIWPNEEDVPVDPETMRATRMPRCPRCGGIARPNILMFGDWAWLSARSDRQSVRLAHFLDGHRSISQAILEIGAGTAVATIRYFSERLAASSRARIIRINPRESEIERPHLALSTSALNALEKIDALLRAGSLGLVWGIRPCLTVVRP
ncbi:MAG: NAD-dependent deacetylase [Acidobacteria bacterium]|nr:MAG: NAD-dependent deacetylase [Acidobacteriota bacterium]